MAEPRDKSPVSLEIQAQGLPRKGRPIDIVADAAQRAALAEAHDLPGVERFEAALVAKPWKADGVRVTGTVRAEITQTCVVTLEPLNAVVEEAVTATFVPEGSRLARNEIDGGAFVLDAEGPDMPEPFTGGRIDVGALAEEFFALGIDPYPRRSDAALEDGRADPDDDGAQAGPLYDQLKKLQRKD